MTTTQIKGCNCHSLRCRRLCDHQSVYEMGWGVPPGHLNLKCPWFLYLQPFHFGVTSLKSGGSLLPGAPQNCLQDISRFGLCLPFLVSFLTSSPLLLMFLPFLTNHISLESFLFLSLSHVIFYTWNIFPLFACIGGFVFWAYNHIPRNPLCWRANLAWLTSWPSYPAIIFSTAVCIVHHTILQLFTYLSVSLTKLRVPRDKWRYLYVHLIGRCLIYCLVLKNPVR